METGRKRWTKIRVLMLYISIKKKKNDTVPHKRLIRKLEGYGITGKLLSWIQSFLINRTRRVVLNGIKSSLGNVTSGIPLGSVLSPILFTIFTNDLTDGVKNISQLFADDT